MRLGRHAHTYYFPLLAGLRGRYAHLKHQPISFIARLCPVPNRTRASELASEAKQSSSAQSHDTKMTSRAVAKAATETLTLQASQETTSRQQVLSWQLSEECRFLAVLPTHRSSAAIKSGGP